MTGTRYRTVFPAMALLLATPVLCGLVTLGVPDISRAAEIDHQAQYASCMRLARRDAGDAFEAALAWADQGGGDAAQHCAATALIEMGKFEHAAHRLQVIASESSSADKALRADLLAQAAQAWMLAEDLKAAEEAISLALNMKPGDPQFLIDRGMIRGQAGRFDGALSDLNEAIGRGSQDPQAFIFRANALRRLNHPRDALQDIEMALRLRPDDPDALFERGNIRQVTGDVEAARRDWRSVVVLAPDSAVAEAARRNIEQLELR